MMKDNLLIENLSNIYSVIPCFHIWISIWFHTSYNPDTVTPSLTQPPCSPRETNQQQNEWYEFVNQTEYIDNTKTCLKFLFVNQSEYIDNTKTCLKT